MNKFIKKLFGKFIPKKRDDMCTTTATLETESDPVDLPLVVKGNKSKLYPRLLSNDPKTKCKGTKKGATHYVRPAGQGLSS